MLHLRYVLDGEDRSYTLAGDRVRIGRGSDNDIVLSDVSVSRYHAEIRRESGRWLIQDLKSTNGIELNRAPVEKAPLQHGDQLAIGIFELAVEDLAEVRRERARDVRDPQAGGEALARLSNGTPDRPVHRAS